jgi:hypothetical protein
MSAPPAEAPPVSPPPAPEFWAKFHEHWLPSGVIVICLVVLVVLSARLSFSASSSSESLGLFAFGLLVVLFSGGVLAVKVKADWRRRAQAKSSVTIQGRWLAAVRPPPSLPKPPRSEQLQRGAASVKRSFEELRWHIHRLLVEKLDLSLVATRDKVMLRREIRLVVERLLDTENPLLNRMERERLIDEVLDEAFGFGPLEVLFKNPAVQDIIILDAEAIRVRCEEGFVPCEVRFRDASHLIQVMDRLLTLREGQGVASPAEEIRLTNGFWLRRTASPVPGQPPVVHLTRRPATATSVSTPSDEQPPRSEPAQRILVRLVRRLHESGCHDVRRVNAAALRAMAASVTREFCTEMELVLENGEQQLLVNEVLAGVGDPALAG